MKLLLVVLVALTLFQGIPANIEDLSQAAEIAYKKGNFEEASQLYQAIIDSGVQTSEVYFNLGNVYYQLHDLGRALLNYRRAEQFIPRDGDLRLNIARIRAQRIDPVVDYVGIRDQITEWARVSLSNSESGQIFLVLWWISCAFLCAYRLLKRWRGWTKWGAIVSFSFLALLVGISGIRIVVDYTYSSAVIINPVVSVLTGPDSNYMQIFELHAAGEVRIIESRNEWVRVQLPDLQEGWIKADSIKVI